MSKMWYRSALLFGCTVIGLGWAGLPVFAQVKNYTPGEYPAPRIPEYKILTVDDLMPTARTLVRKPAERQPLEPGYGIKPGERVLILVSSDFDNRVLEAIVRAIAEAGGTADVMKTYTPPRPTSTANHGHTEARLPTDPSGFGGGGNDIRRDLVALGKYDLLLNGSGGPVPNTKFGWEYIPWDTADKFLYSQAGFPYELQRAMDVKQWELLGKARKIHATDPEGVDMTWNFLPQFIGMMHEEFPGYDIVLAGHLGSFPEFLSPPEAKANGVIAGTINHTGTFPRIVLTLQDNAIVKIDGGGQYGERWKKRLEICKDVQYPGFPAKGCGWFEEAAVGSDVWRVRNLEMADHSGAASWERGRSGVIHWGLGVSRDSMYLPAVKQWEEKNKPEISGHQHVHTYFTTMDFTMADGKVQRIIDKGHLTMLDDPEIRKVAAKYGNPDELLREKWIPAVPGINIPGNYLTDYAPDPWKVIAAQQAELKKKIQTTAGVEKGTVEAGSNMQAGVR